MFHKELITCMLTSCIEIIKKYFKECVILGIGIYLGANLFPITQVVKVDNPPIIKEVEVIKKVPVESGIRTEVVYVPVEEDGSRLDIIEEPSEIKGKYIKQNGEVEYFNFAPSNESFVGKDGKFVIHQKNTAEIDVTEIMDKMNKEERDRHLKEIEKLEGKDRKHKVQNAFWGLLGGYALGRTM